MDKDKIKIIYAGLQGLYAEAHDISGYFYTKEVWEHYHKYIQELNTLTKENYDNYCVTPKYSQTHAGGCIVGSEYKGKLNSLIRVLHEKYFHEDTNPFATSPNTYISQTQQQSQTQSIVLEVQDLLDKKFYTGNLEEKEKTFIEKVKAALPTIKNTVELLNLIVTTAKNSGIDTHQLTKIFGH